MEVILVFGLVAVVAWAAKSSQKNTGSLTHKPRSRPSAGSGKRASPVYRPNPSYHAARKKRIKQAEIRHSLPPIPQDLVIKGRAYVIDGDTIAIRGTKIRLAGIDAPEVDMPWGQKSKWAMVAICKGQIITAELDGERSFDRLVGTCLLPDGRDIGAELIRQGLALDLPCFSRGKYRQFEPAGARRKLANGRFGHGSIKKRQVEGAVESTR